MHVALVHEHVSPILGSTGAKSEQPAAQLHELASSLARAGHQVDVYTRKREPHLENEIRTVAGYRVVNVDAGAARSTTEADPTRYTSAFTSAVRDHWSLRKPDVAHGQSWVSSLATQLAAGAVGIATVVSFHGLAAIEHPEDDGRSDSPLPRASMERTIARSADRIIASCEKEADMLTRMGVARAKIAIVPTGVDLDDFDPAGPAAASGKAKCRVATAGSVPEVAATIETVSRIEDIELIVVDGDPPTSDDVSRLREVAAAENMTDRIVFTGPVRHRHMSTVLRSADLFVCLSPSESAGVITLEAMACGLPVVAFDTGYAADLVVDGVTGRLTDPRNRRLLARELELLVRNDSRRLELGVSGRDRARSRFSWDRIAQDTARIYESAFQVVPTRRQQIGLSRSRAG